MSSVFFEKFLYYLIMATPAAQHEGKHLIVKKSLNAQVYEALKQDILKQNIKFGEKLSNRKLQEKYGVSSSPVRDALNRLYQEGLLESITQGGVSVLSFDYQRALDINEVISLLNREAVALSIARAGLPGAVVLRLEQIVQMQSAHISDEEYYVYDIQFHQVFIDFCGNAEIVKIYAQHSSLWLLLVRLYHADRDSSRRGTLAEHRQIVESYRIGNIPKTQELLSRHFQAAAVHLENTLRKA
ncbi:transcriptional regulator [Spirochaetia bacterium]|nr:transcriptional regulator [Spirochaetia bacterium]